MKDKEFLKELDLITQENYKKLFNALKDCPVKTYDLKFEVEITEEMKSKYGLDDNFRFFAVLGGYEGPKMEYDYKGIKLDPDCYWLRPDDYHEVSTLQILHECMKQDTYRPDIKFLERGEKEK
jgi:hypothetical protein